MHNGPDLSEDTLRVILMRSLLQRRYRVRVAIYLCLGFMLWLMAFNAHAAGISIASTCNPVAQSACGLPFPSDLFRNTAGKLNYSNRIFDRRITGPVHAEFPVATQLPANFTAATIFNQSSGFSALGPVAFELSAFPVNEIPADGRGVLVVFDRTTLEDIPLRVSLSKVANPQRELRDKSPVVIAWPRARFEFGREYIAVLLRDQLRTENLIQPFMSPSAGMQRVLDGTANYFVQNAYNPVLEKIDQKGILRSNILAATYFTVRPEAEVVEPLRQMVAQAIRQPLGFTDMKVRDSLGSKDYGYATYSGHLRMVNFRHRDGGVYPPYTPVPDAELEHVEFILSLPESELGESLPVTLWGHGLANDKALAKSAFTRYDDIGVATFAIDHPNHASRVILPGNKAPHIAALVRSPQNMMHLLGMFVQSSIDFAVAAQTVHDDLPGIISNLQKTDNKVGAIDNSRIIYQGVSLGGMVGASIGATAPYLQGAFLINGASSLMQVFSESVMWDGNTSMVVPFNANGAEAVVMLAMMQHYVDIADGTNFAHLFRSPPAGQSPRKLGMLYAVGDGSLVNSASLATAEIAQLPLLKSVIEPVPYLPEGVNGSEGHVNGYGILQSGFGSKDAQTVLDQIEALDPTAGGNSNYLALLEQLGVFTGQSEMLDALSDLVGAGLLSQTDQDSFSDWINTLYQGDIETFLTHFNRNSVEAVTSNINWACELLALNPGRCAFARQKAAIEDDNDDNVSPTPLPEDLINRAQDTLDDLLEDGAITIKVESGSGGALDWTTMFLFVLVFIACAAFRYRWSMAIFLSCLRHPAFRTLSSAVLSMVTWGGWALWVNGWQSEPGMHAGFSQGLTSFITTLFGSVLLEWLFNRFGPGLNGCITSATVVSSISLTLMLIVHQSTNTPHIFMTVMPVYAVVVLYCSAYVATLRKLALSGGVRDSN